MTNSKKTVPLPPSTSDVQRRATSAVAAAASPVASAYTTESSDSVMPTVATAAKPSEA